MEAVGDADGLSLDAGSRGEGEAGVAVGAETISIAGFAEGVDLYTDIIEVGEIVAVGALEAL